MSNILKIILIFSFLTNCSYNKNSKFWTNEKIIQEKQTRVEEIFKKKNIIKLVLNPDLKISLYSKVINNSFLNNFDNNNGRVNFNGDLVNKSKFKFSKIDNFFQYNPEIVFEKDNIIFFDNKGSIIKFSNDSELIWKKNYYSKNEKKQKPILFFGSSEKTLIVADNIAKYYAIDINTGELLWSNNNTAPFNSQIKIYKDKFFIIDFNNTLSAYYIKNGKKVWSIKTNSSLVRSQKKLSMVIVDEKIYFNNSSGDISSVDIKSGELIWQSPTQSSLIYDDSFFLSTSDIIADKKNLYLSNNKGNFFSLDIDTGVLNWKQNINSNLRSTLIDNYIFTVSLEGFLVITEKTSGKIIRITDLFGNSIKSPKLAFINSKRMNPLYIFDKKIRENKGNKRSKFKPTGFIVGTNNIYLSTDHGRLFIIDIATGTTSSILKIDNGKISRPSVLNKNMYIIKDNSIIKLN